MKLFGPPAVELEALRERWLLAWPGALALWSRYTQLHDPTWCLTRQQEADAGLEGSFAMIRFVDHSVVISLRQVAERGLGNHPREILAHEIGHHVYCPGDLTDHARLIARIRPGIPGKERLAPFLANIYGDLLINDRLQRQAGLDLAGVYRLLGGGSTDTFWTLYLRIYEILWSLGSGSLAGARTEQVDSDAHLGARLARVYARDWLDGAGRFAALCYPYLRENDGEGIRKLLEGWHDTRDAGQGGEPGGLAEIDEAEEGGAIHPSLDPAITGIDAQDQEQAAGRAGAGAPGPGSDTGASPPPRKRYREPAGYGDLLRSAGVRISDEEATARYYRERALPHLMPFPARRTPRALEPLPEGLEVWERGEPLEQVDWLQSVIVSPRVVPGLTTVQRTFGTSPGEEPERVPLDLYVGIDCSGSMVDPRRGVSYPVLAGCVIALSALRAGARVMAVLSGHPGLHSATAGFVDDEREVLRILTGYLGTGYAFGIPLLAGAFAARRPTDRPAHILIVSDHDIFAMLDGKTDGRPGWKIAREALAAARGGGTFVLHMPLSWEEGKTGRLRKEGWQVHGIQEWEDIVPFARELSRRTWGDGEGGGVRHEGPPLEQLLRRLTECPPDVLPVAAAAEGPAAFLPAVVGDLLRDLGGGRPDPRRLEAFRRLQAPGADRRPRNEARLVLVACWLLHDPWFLQQRRFADQARDFLERGLAGLAALVQAERFVDDPDRREELARAALAALDLRPQGETEPQARDRRTTLDSVERHAVLQRTRAAEERVRREREVREAMARKAAQEAAGSYGRE